MTDEVIRRLTMERHVLLLEFIRHTLAAAHAVRLRARADERFGRPVSGAETVIVDVERLFAAVDLLIGRFDQPWSPFVSAWSPGLESFASTGTIHRWDIEADLSGFERALSHLGDPEYRYRSVPHEVNQRLAEGIQRVLMRLGIDLSVLLTDVREEMLRSLFDMLRIEGLDPVKYLSPLIDLAQRQGDLTVATLNYDRSIELLAEGLSVRCDTGIDTWLARGELGWEASGLRLLKLHGSIDWVIESRAGSTARSPL